MIKKIATWFIDYKKKYENSALILVGLSMIVFVIIIVSSFTSILPDKWKFDPDAYGTVSDWVMVFVTLVTAVFLYRTLRSQMMVQRDQKQLLTIETQKYHREIKPNINYTLTVPTDIRLESDMVICAKFTITTDKPCLVKAVIAGKKSLGLNINFTNDYKSEEEIFHFDNIENDKLSIYIEYSDSDGNQYIILDEAQYDKINPHLNQFHINRKGNHILKAIY